MLEKLGASYKAVRKGKAIFDTDELVDKLELNPAGSSVFRKLIFWRELNWATNRIYHFGNHDGLTFEPIGNNRYVLRFENHKKAGKNRPPEPKPFCSGKE